MFLKKYLSIALIIIPQLLLAQEVTPIATIKNNDSNGVPVNLGNVYTISGVVTVSNQLGSSGPGAVQDESGAISIYGGNFANNVQIGDSVIITAPLDEYKGLTQLNVTGSGASVSVISSNNNVEPEVVTINQILSQEWNGFEEFESKLIRINNVTVTGTGNFDGGTSGKNYTITDTSGSMDLRIDESVNIAGTPIPSGKIDVIGIIGQYKFASPYNSGYELFPRFVKDIIDDGSPVILSPIIASNIDTTSFTVFFNTARNGNSQVKYGLTENLEIDSVLVDEDTTFHAVQISGLKPGYVYYYKAFSSNSNGMSESDLKTVTTASNDTSLGQINVYFNFSVDTSIALAGNKANGNTDFKQKLLYRINHANSSIDMAVYSFFGMQDIADALIFAKNRGVKIRVVYDNRTIQNSMQSLINAGIKVSMRPSSLSGIMHNKFFVFDARDSIASNDWLWTGSWNVTSSELTWKNNVVEIHDPTITKAYQTEFEEMWGSSDETPNSSEAKFGNQKSDNTPHNFSIGGRDVRMYFSPSDGTNQQIINEIDSADYNIYLAQYVITRNDIEAAIHNRYNNNVQDIRAVVDQINTTGSEFTYMSSYAEMLENTGATLHHKYAIIDALHKESRPMLITGSHNWSSAAETSNDENTLFINDYKIVNQYLQEFKQRYNDMGGTGVFVFPSPVNDKSIKEFSYHLYQNYPNPFNPVTTIRFELPYSQRVELAVFDMLGRKVKTLFNNNAPAGIVTVDFNAENLASGVYFYRLKTDNAVITKKLMLMK